MPWVGSVSLVQSSYMGVDWSYNGAPKEGGAALCCMHTGCGAGFGTFKRRHHCRVCGLIFCQLHSANRCIVPAAFGYSGRSKKRILASHGTRNSLAVSNLV